MNVKSDFFFTFFAQKVIIIKAKKAKQKFAEGFL